MIGSLLLAACQSPDDVKANVDSPPSDTAPTDSTPTHTTDSPDDTVPPDTGVTLDYPDQRVGIFYLAWHAYAADAMARLAADQRRTVEDAIRDDTLSPAELLQEPGLLGEAASFHYHLEPEAGFYCLYRAREGDPAHAEPDAAADCVGTDATAATHAARLWDAGIDFVYADLTNLPTWSAFTDVLGVRPFEVLLEEWAALRRAGTPTPQVAAWVPATASSDPTFRQLLPLYAAYPELILTHAGQPVLFIVDHDGLPPDTSFLAEISAAGLLPVPLWGNLGAADLAAGTAGWMQPCTDGGSFTTRVTPTTPCAQGYTSTSPLGTVLSTSLSYQVGYASLPMQAAGRLGGLTFQKQFETALAVQPDYLIVNAWNEMIAQPQANPYDAALGGLRHSMGEEALAESDAAASWLWVDMYGVEFDRDFEPTVEGGDEPYQLLASCLRVYRSGATTCSDTSEACCQLAEGVTLIRSFAAGAAGSATDHVLTADAVEIAALVAGGWTEVCNPFYGPPGLCGGGTTGDGPFSLYPVAGTDRSPLYRCWSGADHFVSSDASCEGRTTESQLGWVSTVRTSETPRPLRRCYADAALAHAHSLDATCPTGFRDEAVLGYVR